MAAKKRDGIVYSTDPDFNYNDVNAAEEHTIPPSQQILYVWIDSRNRSGKIVTLIKGFKGTVKDLELLAAALKKLCGSGGTVKNGEIVIQGDFRNKILSFLSDKGYKAKKAGG
jgi:translation initiation factor 1